MTLQNLQSIEQKFRDMDWEREQHKRALEQKEDQLYHQQKMLEEKHNLDDDWLEKQKQLYNDKLRNIEKENDEQLR